MKALNSRTRHAPNQPSTQSLVSTSSEGCRKHAGSAARPWRTSRLATWPSAAICCAALVACGGGGDQPEIDSTASATSATAGIAGPHLHSTEASFALAPADTAQAEAIFTGVESEPGATSETSTPEASFERAKILRAVSETRQRDLTGYFASYTGKAYFVDSTLGNDNGAGTEQQPWKTLSRAARTSLQPGDALLLNCAGRWRESIEFGPSFAPRGGVLIGAYGVCDPVRRPEINGGRPSATGWTFTSRTRHGDVFTANVSGPIATVFRGATNLTPARHPNLTTITADFSLSQPGTSASRLVLSPEDRASVGNISLAGAALVMRTAPYSVERTTVAGYDAASGAATLATKTSETPIAGAGYYLAGQRWMLDAHNEWLHDESTSTLYFFKGRNAPNSDAPIEFTRPETNVTVRGISNVRIEHLRIVNAGEDGLRVVESPQARITGVEVRNARSIGINVFSTSGLPSAQGVRVESSTVMGAGSTGIAISVSSGIVEKSLVSDVGTASSDVKPVGAIRLSGAESSAVGNTVVRSGFKGIVFANTRNVVISKNTVSEACLRLTDCGAIYGWGANNTGTRALVSENQISKSTVANTNGAAGGAPQLIAGVYLDEGASHVDVVSNYVSDVKVGINLHKASFNRISRNHLVATQDAAFRAQSSGNDLLSVKGNSIDNNLFYVPNYFVQGPTGVPVKSGGIAQMWIHQTDAPGMFRGPAANVIANNVAIHLGDAAGLRWRMQSGAAFTDHESVGWSAFAPTDRTDQPYRARMVGVTGQPLLSNTTMEYGGAPWTTYSYVRNSTIVDFANQTACGGPCAVFTPVTANDVLMQTGLQQLPGASNLMFVRYRAIGAGATTTSRLEVREDAPPYKPVYMESNIALPAHAQRNQEVFFEINTRSALRVSIKGSVGAAVMFDDVQLYQVASYRLLSPMTPLRLLVNTDATAQSYECTQLATPACDLVDEAGKPVAVPVVVPPNSARMVFIRSSTWMNLQ